ncbi:hypothetical protein BDZ89DRAFT_1086184, partial [Hymenopellis radicata]
MDMNNPGLVFQTDTCSWTAGQIPVASRSSSAFPVLAASTSCQPPTVTAQALRYLALTCSWCSRLLTFNTVVVSRGLSSPQTFGTVWVLECGHLLDTFCATALLLPHDCAVLEMSTTPATAEVPDDYQPICIEKVYRCRGQDCNAHFATFASDPDPPQCDAWNSGHAPGPWRFSNFPTPPSDPDVPVLGPGPSSSNEGQCSLTPFANRWSDRPIHGRLDDLYRAGHNLDTLSSSMRGLDGSTLRAPRLYRSPQYFIVKYATSYFSSLPCLPERHILYRPKSY